MPTEYEKILIKCKFLDAEGNPKGRDYTYFFNAKVEQLNDGNVAYHIPLYVQTIEGKKLIVTNTDASYEEISGFADKVKMVYEIPVNGDDKGKAE